jgi:hypothetical protein
MHEIGRDRLLCDFIYCSMMMYILLFFFFPSSTLVQALIGALELKKKQVAGSP